MTDPFTVDAVAQIMRHMNTDHADDNLLIVRRLGSLPQAESARMSGMDGQGIEFIAQTPQGEQSVRLSWSQTITERGQVRSEVVKLHEQALHAASEISD